MSRLEAFISEAKAGHTEFEETLAIIDSLFRVTPCEFNVGQPPDVARNSAGSNTGALRVLAFGQLLGLDEATTLNLFGRHYRSVLDNPHGEAHNNIRHFIRYGWSGVEIIGAPLHPLDPGLIGTLQRQLRNEKGSSFGV